MLSGSFKHAATPVGGDYRAVSPRFQGDAYRANVELVDEIAAIATAKKCQPAEVALAWVLGRGDHVMTIPGTTKLANLKTNLAAYELELGDDEQMSLETLADRVMGDRYDERGMSIING